MTSRRGKNDCIKQIFLVITYSYELLIIKHRMKYHITNFATSLKSQLELQFKVF